MAGRSLSELFEDERHFLVTAHRGASYEYPENTALAMRKAVEAGADMIEFDLRGTAYSEDVPILLHDATIDRVSDKTGSPLDMLLPWMRQMNFSCFVHGARQERPVYERLPVSTFEEILEEFAHVIPMNIQLACGAEDEALLRRICDLFRQYELAEWGYLTVDFAYVPFLRGYAPEIELCVTPPMRERATPENLRRCREEFGCRFVQPSSAACTAETFRTIRLLGLRANVFYADTVEEAARLRDLGALGALTNRPELLCPWRDTQ